ncbi:MAG: D-alanine--D-alanine ligase [Planctomycetes bacterium]|nr:D-alanine--D-alanine ligase [Planctomycetota bacterium]
MKNSSRTEAIADSFWKTLLPGVEALSARRVAVLMGGVGPERDVSLMSGKAVFDALRLELDDLLLLDVADPGPSELKILLDRVDTVFIALHGTYGEDGTIQGFLDQLGVPYTGSGSKAAEDSFFKDVSRAAFLATGVPVAEGRCVPVRRDLFLQASGAIGLPLVVKPCDSGSSVGVTIVRGRGEALERAFAAAADVTERGLLLERYIEGRELTVGVLAGLPLPVVELLPAREFYDYEAKYTDPATQYRCPADLPPDIAAAVADCALRAFKALGCAGFGRVDVMLDDKGPVVLEVNSIPGFTSHSLLPMAARAAGLDLTALALLILAQAGKG